LDSKPIVIAQLGLTTLVTIIAAGMLEKPVSLILLRWLAAIWLMTAAVYCSALAIVGGSTTSLFGIPSVVLNLLVVTVRRGESTWQRTRRQAEI
jgi:hypothetical protein